ncbi:MAG: LamG domain-containing protein [Candidatus Brocadiae bacterium]|nr:LamG domain-containing protein [Candidatus Brocadiia bacterium]
MLKSPFLIALFLVSLLSMAIQAANFTDAVAAYDMQYYVDGNLYDASGHGHNSLALGGAEVVNGLYGKALQFDGSDQLNIADNSALRLGTQITLAATFIVTSRAADWVRVVGKGEAGPRNYGLWYHPNLNYFLFQMYGANGNVDARLTATVQLNTVYHMVGTYDGSTARLYLNGTQVATHSVVMNPYTSTDPLTIGGANFHAKHIGLIDNVAVYNQALSASEITQYSSGNLGATSLPIPEPSCIMLIALALGYGILKKVF